MPSRLNRIKKRFFNSQYYKGEKVFWLAENADARSDSGPLGRI